MKWLIGSIFIGMGATPALAIPSAIAYQGALRDNGAPANGRRTMSFRITNQDGTRVFWSSGDMTVQVNNGIFATQINPTQVDWERITPYLEVSVEGQQLLPREPVSATVYASVANSVVDSSISPSKVADGFGLVPSGLIALFARSCPAGWSRFSALDNAFPRGGTTFGATGGTETHSHVLQTVQVLDGGGATAVGTIRGGSGVLAAIGGPGGFRVDARGADTTANNHVPPYVTMVFCEKT